MQEGMQLPELLARIKVLREVGLRAEHVAFSFMKRRVQPLMAHDTLGFEYTGNDDTSRMPGDEVDDDDIVDSWRESSRTCHHTRRAPSRSIPPRARRRR
jgi:hypothetical protein